MPESIEATPASSQGFVHLHLHSQYSLLDGGNRLDRLVARIKDLGMDAVAVTDHGNLYGAADFYAKAKDAGIKPILGIEAYVAPEVNGVSDRTSREYTGVQDGGHHLVLLAENQTGWSNLLKLSSDAYLKGFYFKPRMDKATLAQWADGLIAINGHLGSSLAFHLLQHVRAGQTPESCKHYQAAVKEAKWHAQVFAPCPTTGAPRFYIELQRHDTPEQLDINPSLIRLADELGLPLVADNDAHFLNREDYDAHDVLCCISMGKTREDVNRLKYPRDVYVKSPDEMHEAFGLDQSATSVPAPDSVPAGSPAVRPDCEVPPDRAREAIENTRRIADRCNVELDFNANHAPVVKIACTTTNNNTAETDAADLPVDAAPALERIDAFDSEHPVGSAAWYQAFCNQFELQPYNSEAQAAQDLAQATGQDQDQDQDQPPDPQAALKARCDGALRLLAEAGAVWRYGRDGLDASTDLGQQRRARLERELAVLRDKNISAYFLIVWDFVNEARRRGIPVNARGSGVGTMVGYCLALSNACPIEYGLLFERFTDPDRSEYPDIDIDMCQDGRQSLIDYVRDKYGHVAQIITFNVLKARQAVRDVGRVLDIPLNEVDKVCKLIGDGLGTTIDKALDAEPDLRKMIDQSPRYRELIDMARKLEGMTRHAGIHAAGVIVATQPLDNIVPLCKASGSDAVVTQWDGPTCEKVGLLKMDFLGLRTLSIITRAKELIQETLSSKVIVETVKAGGGKARLSGPSAGDNAAPPTVSPAPLPRDPLELERLTFDDPNVFGLFQRGETAGVFQFESGGMRNLLVAMRPDRLEDLIAANALYRPGPMDLIPDYNDRKHGRSPVPQINEHVDDITAQTHGIMVYQEQVMQVLNRLGNIPLRKAYTIIKAISKKKAKVIDAARLEFIQGAADNGLGEKQANELFDLILKFAGYGFNKSHSTGYAIVAYQTAYLKTYFPVQYMAAVLTYESVSTDKVKQYMDECRFVRRPDGDGYAGGRGIEVKPPDINVSGLGFTPVFTEDEAATAAAAAAGGHIRFGLGAVKGVGTSAIEAIIREREARGPYRSLFDFCERIPHAGGGSVNRATVEALVKCGAFDELHGQHRRSAMCEALEAAMRAGQQAAALTQSDDFLFGAVAEADREAAAANTAPGEADQQALPDIPAWTQQQTLDFEMEVLGQYVSSHPLDDHRDAIERYRTCTIEDAKRLSDDVPVTLGAMVKSTRTVVTKKGDKMAIVSLEDASGGIEAVLFPKTYAMHHAALEGEGAIVLFVIGKCDRKRGEPQVIVDRLVAVADAKRTLTQQLTIVLDDRRPPEEGASFNGELAQLKQVLQQASRGPDARTAVALELRQAGHAVTLRLGTRVAICDDLLGHIRAVLEPARTSSGEARFSEPSPSDSPPHANTSPTSTVRLHLAGPPKLFQSTFTGPGTNGTPDAPGTPTPGIDPALLHDGTPDRMRSAPVSRAQDHLHDDEACASIDRY